MGGFLVLQSMAGGTGAGLGTYVAQVRYIMLYAYRVCRV
jgi:hypothetical protein